MLCLPEAQLKKAIPSANPVAALKDHAVSLCVVLSKLQTAECCYVAVL